MTIYAKSKSLTALLNQLQQYQGGIKCGYQDKLRHLYKHKNKQFY